MRKSIENALNESLRHETRKSAVNKEGGANLEDLEDPEQNQNEDEKQSAATGDDAGEGDAKPEASVEENNDEAYDLREPRADDKPKGNNAVEEPKAGDSDKDKLESAPSKVEKEVVANEGLEGVGVDEQGNMLADDVGLMEVLSPSKIKQNEMRLAEDVVERKAEGKMSIEGMRTTKET